MGTDSLDEIEYEPFDMKPVLRGVNRELKDLKILRETAMPPEAKYGLSTASTLSGHQTPREGYWTSSGSDLDYWPARQSV